MQQMQDMARGDVLTRAFFLGEKEFSIEDCYSEYASSFNGRLHFHDFYELSVIYEGSSRFMVNGAVYDLGVGAVHLARPSDYHRQLTQPEEHIRYYNLQFAAEFLPPELIQAIEACAQPLCAELSGADWQNVLRLVQALYREYKKEPEDPLTRRFLCCNTENLCLYLLRGGTPILRESGETLQEPIRRALALIQKRYREELRLGTVAEAVGLSAPYFSALFHETVGETFSSYLTGYRLQIACRYLRSEDLSGKQVAAICGFGSYSYFVTMFRKQYGVPPKKWREMY